MLVKLSNLKVKVHTRRMPTVIHSNYLELLLNRGCFIHLNDLIFPFDLVNILGRLYSIQMEALLLTLFKVQ